MADDGFTAFFQDAYPRVVGQLRLLTKASRWRQLVYWGGASHPPVRTHADGAVQVYVLEPDRPPATP